VDRAQKEAVVAELGQIFADSGVVVVAHYEGLTVAEPLSGVGSDGARCVVNKVLIPRSEDCLSEGNSPCLTVLVILEYHQFGIAGLNSVALMHSA
jgi:hypothetical protein